MIVDIFNTVSSNLITGFFRAIARGNWKIKALFTLSVILIISAITLNLLVDGGFMHKLFQILAGILAVLGIVIIIGIGAYQMDKDDAIVKEKLQEVEKSIRDNPNQPAAAWELARIKLESYLNRNITQIRWIFVWTVLVMIVGFVIIGYGIVKIYEGDKNLNSVIITSVVGLIIEFIGATFLIIYKSTMTQAKDYVNVLERINAVGMSVQIVDRIEEDQKLKNQTGAELAKLLLELYNVKT